MPWNPSGIDQSPVLLPDQNSNLNSKGKRKRLNGPSSPKPLTKKFKPQQQQPVADGGAVQSLPTQLSQSNHRFTPDGLHQSYALAPVATTPTIMPPGENQKPAYYGANNSGVISPALSSAPLTPFAPAHFFPGVTTSNGMKPLQPATSYSPRPIAVQTLNKESFSQIPSQLPTPTISPVGSFAESKPKPRPAHKPTMKIDTDTLRAIVEMEINNAILQKHNELRLIDQEIAKVQVAMEQIRRCEIIPRPAQQIPSAALMSHSGPALLPAKGLSIPESPAPWGVTDGPYTRHYAAWLLPSARFDAQSPVAQTAVSSAFPSPFGRESRATRGLALEPVSTPFGRPSRTGTGRVRAANAHDPSSPLAPRDPLVIKRQKDGLFVKLYCANCNPERSDFANVQGFLNHCRISHKLDFKSHEAAAIECGRPVDSGSYFPSQPEPQAQTPAPQQQQQPQPTSQPQQPMSAREVRTPFSAGFSFPPAELKNTAVHSLNKAGVKSREGKIIARSYSTPEPKSVEPAPADSFVPANDIPFLSTLLSKRGFAGNMSHIVTEAKLKVDLSEYSDESDAEAVEGDKKAGKKTKGKSKSKPKPKSAKPIHQTPTSSLITSSSGSAEMMGLLRHSDDENDDNSLSPHTAATDYSNPGLVSDRDDEYEEDEDTEMVDEQVVGGDVPKERVMIVDMMETDNVEETGEAVCGATRR
jgi:ADA HAT complex component 1